MLLPDIKLTLPNGYIVEFEVLLDEEDKEKTIFKVTIGEKQYRARFRCIVKCAKIVYQAVVPQESFTAPPRGANTQRWLEELMRYLEKRITRDDKGVYQVKRFANAIAIDGLLDLLEPCD